MCEVKPVFKQFFAIVCCNLLTLSAGSLTGWATINFNDLQNENSTFATGPLTLSEASMVVSLVNVGGFIGNFAILPLMQIVGVKRTIHSLGVALLASSLCIIWAKNVYFLYLSRLLSGIAGGALVVGIPSLINDISFARVRGALNSLFDPSYNFGVIISFFLGNYLSCVDQAKTQLVVPIIFLILMFLLHESPEYWASKNNEKKALESRQFYQGTEEKEAPEKGEFIPKEQNGNVEKGQLENVVNDESSSKLTLADFLTPHAKRAFFIAFTSLALSFFSGTLTIISYVTDIFNRTGSSLSKKNSSTLVSFTQIIANLVMLNIVERFNRRTLYIWSSILTTASYLLFAVYCLLWYRNPAFEWMPPFCFACIVYFSCMGLLPIPYIFATEVFPAKIRQVCLAIAVFCMWVQLFGMGLVLPYFFETFGLSTCMAALAGTSFLSVLFGIFCVPETRGKTFEEIAEILSK